MVWPARLATISEDGYSHSFVYCNDALPSKYLYGARAMLRVKCHYVLALPSDSLAMV